jgi:acetoin utilization deacetylase AcuC-like enzyme
MLVVHSPDHARHDPAVETILGVPTAALEHPRRAETILAGLEAEGRHEVVAPRDHGVDPILAVHDPAMVRFLETCWDRWHAAGHEGPLVGDTFLLARYRGAMGEAPEPSAVEGGYGYWCFDTATPIVAGTYRAARSAVDVALTAGDAVLDGARAAYGLCRPPGHHAARSMFGGYCFFNNAAVVAQWLVAAGAGRVGILDVDYHHGNGTQQLFWERPDVPYASLHGDPLRAFPYYSGHADETGGGPGTGATLNLPLPAGTDDGAYLAALERALDWLDGRCDDVLVVSLGMDTDERDPLGDLRLTTMGYTACGRLVASLGRRLVILQEGGYFVPALGDNVAAWLGGAEEG